MLDQIRQSPSTSHLFKSETIDGVIHHNHYLDLVTVRYTTTIVMKYSIRRRMNKNIEAEIVERLKSEAAVDGFL